MNASDHSVLTSDQTYSELELKVTIHGEILTHLFVFRFLGALVHWAVALYFVGNTIPLI